MRVTYHAAQRFIERVLDKKSFSRKDMQEAKAFLENLTQNIVISSYRKNFVLPGFSRFACVYQEDALLTIIPKN